MQQTFVFCMLLYAVNATAQTRPLSIGISYRPELTQSRDDISYRWKPHPARTRYNQGVALGLEYHFAKHFSAATGAGFVSRTFQTHVFFNQAAIPPPRRSFTEELVTAYPVSYRIFEFPLSIGYVVVVNKKIAVLVDAGYLFDYLWNASYLPNPGNYSGVYIKRYWLGGSLKAGGGLDYKINNTLKLCSSFTYAFGDINKKEPFLFTQDDPTAAINHKYMFLLLGIKKQLK